MQINSVSDMGKWIVSGFTGSSRVSKLIWNSAMCLEDISIGNPIEKHNCELSFSMYF